VKLGNIWSLIRGILHLGYNKDINNTVFLTSLPRSGSTWLAEIISYKNEFRYMFEPFFPKYVFQARRIGEYEYLRPGEHFQLAQKTVRRIITGRIRNPWVDRFNKRVVYKRILIKDVRTNLIAGWLNHNFPDMKIILLLRHPFATSLSLRRLKWGPSLKRFISQAKLVEDHLTEFLPKMKEAKSEWEMFIFMWCILYYVPLKQLAFKKNCYICYYEKFCSHPFDETLKLMKWLNCDIGEIREENFKRPSSMAKKGSAVLSGKNRVTWWVDKINKSEVDCGVEILKYFGLDEIYDGSPFPKI